MGCPLKAHAEHFIHTASHKLALRDSIWIFKNGLWLHTTRPSTTISQFQWPWKNKVWSLIMLCRLLIYKQAFTLARTKDGTVFLFGTGFWGKEKTSSKKVSIILVEQGQELDPGHTALHCGGSKGLLPISLMILTTQNCIPSVYNGPLDSSIPWCCWEQ